MSTGRWAYSLGTATHLRGVYQWDAQAGTWEPMAPLPYVHGRLIRRGADGRVSGVSYRISPDASGPATVVDRDQVRTGEWADLVGLVLSADDRITRAAATAVRRVADTAEAVEMAPRWRGGRLDAPPPDVGPAGYGLVAGGVADARSAWRLLVAVMAGSPRLSLAVGAAVGGLFFATLEKSRIPFVCYLTGQAQRGKSTALNLAAGVFGDPTETAIPMNVSKIGVTSYLGELGEYPAFMDELGTSGMGASDLESFIFSITGGGKRTVGARTGGTRKSPAWRSVAIMTGNDSIVGRVANEGIGTRVVEIPTPITVDPADADLISDLLMGSRDGTISGCYGWPLRWISADPRITDFHAALERAEHDLPLPAGGVPKTIGRHLALCIAGTERLEEITGMTGARDAAILAARECLTRSVEEIEERGATAGDRLYAAVMQAVTARPAAFPTVEHYESLAGGETADGLRLANSTEGFLIGADVGVLTSCIDSVATDNNLTDVRTALRDLRERDLLAASDGMGLRFRKRILGRRTEMYLFRGEEHGAAPAAPETPPVVQPQPAPVAVDEMDRALELLTRELGAVLLPEQEQPAAGMSAVGMPQAEPAAEQPELPVEPDVSAAAAVEPTAPTAPVPAQSPGQSEMRHDVAAFARLFADQDIEVSDNELTAALTAFEWAVGTSSGGNLKRPLYWSFSSADTGRRLFTMLQSRGRRVERLTAPDGSTYGEDYGPQHLPAETIRPLTEIERGHSWIVGFDVNAQYLAAAGSLYLGNGAPMRWRQGDIRVDNKVAGLYRLTVRPDAPQVRGGHPEIPGLVEPGDGWYSQPIAQYLHRAGAIETVHEKWEWAESRTWLSSWVKCIRGARALLMTHRGERPYDLALTALKSVYSAFLGGWLASTEHNRTELLRPDWRDAIQGAARANQHRHVMRIHEASGQAPFMVYKDAMYFTAESPDVIPGGLALSEQPGKWKPHRMCLVSDVADALDSGSASTVNRAIIRAVKGGGEDG